MPTDLPNNLVRTIPVIFERLMGGESAAEIAADYTREGAPLLPDDFAPIADAIARLRRLESRPVDPVAALRAVLARNARIPYLEAEIAHLRKHNASAELEAIRAALAESPVPNAPADCDLAGWVRYLLRGWRSERKEASELANLCQQAHNALTSVGAPEGGTPAVRIFHLEVSHQRRISELEAKVRALAAERDAK